MKSCFNVVVVALLIGLPWPVLAQPKERLPGSPDRSFNARLQGEIERFDPGVDGWDTEVFQTEATAQIKAWSALLVKLANDEAIDLSDTVDVECAVQDLRPPMQIVYQSDRLKAWRGQDSGEAKNHSGHRGMVEAMRRFMDPWKEREGSIIDYNVKIYTVETSEVEGQRKTRIILQLHGRRGEVDWFQQNTVWLVTWKIRHGTLPVIHQVEPISHDEALSAGGQLFAEATPFVFAGEDVFREHLRHGIDHWRAQTERSIAPGITAHHGVAVGDANGDGLDDVFLPQPLSLPDRLLIQQDDGTVEDVASLAGLDSLDPHSSALWLDLDNDADQDLVVAGDGGAMVYENRGALQFVKRAKLPFSSTVDSMAAADYDGDQLIDLYFCGHTAANAHQQESVLGVPIPVYDAENGQANLLVRNEGGFRFSDATERSGLDVNNSRFSYAAAWEDFDNDGDQDLYVANDFGRNNLYLNTGGVFTDIAASAGVEDISSGMSVSWADYNRDGYMDLYVGNMFSSAGNRIAYQRQFREGSDAESQGFIRRMARGNTLFENRGHGGFRDVSVDLGVTMGRWAWSSRFIDLNGDGWEDLAIANGFVTNVTPDDL